MKKAIVPDNIETVVLDNNDDYHHHVKASEELLLWAKDTNRPLIAICGQLVHPKKNPLAHPCCPRCNKLTKKSYCT